MPMDEFKKIAVQAALKGGEILNEHRGKVKHIGYKGEVNLVTEVDKISEETILKIIKKNFTDHAILTEESEGKKSKSTYKWIIDPLDGTTNYAHDFPMYCVSVALEKDGEIILGVVYNPNLDELFVAEKGNGAIFSEGFRGHKLKRKISVSQTAELSQSLLATGFPYDIRKSKIDNLDHFANFYKKAQAVRRGGSAALDLCYLAMGRFDGFWELKLSPWDMAAGKLMVEEAGGRVTDFLGGQFNIYLKEILGSNGKIHQQMIEILKLSL
ncbi:MAG: inositol monophosphatase [candidate division Zixibacteria bacterium]|nr:inositol monophosphatase [candidate division Zixibacteria bacterium]